GVAGLALRDQTDRTLVPELVNTLGGATLPGAFPREDAAVDPMARSALAAAASQCPEYVPDANLAGSADYSKVSSFQNSFTLAQTFRARLSAIRERTHLALGSVSGDLKDELERDVIRVANRASAEIRAWAGPGEAWMARAGGFPSEFPNYFDVRLV